MPSPESTASSVSTIESELYFLIARFLSSGPCKKASELLLEEVKEHKLLPKRIDWEGQEHYRSYSELADLYRHISNLHLLRICERLGPLLDKEVPPSITGVRSLLGAGSLSLLRTIENSKKTRWLPSQVVVQHRGEPLLPPSNIATLSLQYLLKARELGGKCQGKLLLPCQQYDHISHHGRKLGHLSAVYCVTFDRTGQNIITGADDHLVKIWSVTDGRLLATLRGHSAEITDLAINFENTLLAVGSCDKIIRVWCMRTKAPVAVLQGHTGMITSVQFCPQTKGDTRYLGSTGADGCVCFWQWNVVTLKFNLKPLKFVERSRAGAQMLCSSFSPGGLFLATGNSDNVIRVYFFHAATPEKICELEAHKDRVDSIMYSNMGMRFISGSKDGTARIWRYERQEWKALVLNMSTKKLCNITPVIEGSADESKKDKLRVTMVAWTTDDTQVITAVSDFTLKVWDSRSGKLIHVLQGHQDEVYVLEPSPKDPRILLSAGHDGNVIIWNMETGCKIKSFFNMIEGQGHGAVFDCKFSPDGQSFAAVDSHGHMLIFGFGSNEKFKRVPSEVYFHTDYRPLIRDANNYVLDEQTQQAPHLMPPPFLVDIDGNPYRPKLQRLVPGRENCKEDTLVPEVAVNEEGSSEVIGEGEVILPADPVQNGEAVLPADPVQNGEAQNVEAVLPADPVQNGDAVLNAEAASNADLSHNVEVGSGTEAAAIGRDRPSIDAMIQRLLREQEQRFAREGREPLASPPPVGSPPPFVSPRTARNNQGRVGMRRSGETEGVRQSLGNISLRATNSDIAALKRRVVIRPLDPETLWRSEEKRSAYADEEFKKFVFERKKKPNSPHSSTSTKTNRKKSRVELSPAEHEETARNRLSTRALYDTEEEEEEDGNTSGSDFVHESDSDEYSDWMGDTGSILQPPTRTSQRQRKRKRLTSTEDDDDDDDIDVDVDKDSDEHNSSSNVEKRPKKNKPPPKKKKARESRSKTSKVSRNVAELPEAFRPPEWLTDTIPRKAPFFPQMGDEVMYFRQGHELYLKAVKRHKVYEVNISNNQPWHKIPNLREQELVRIVGVKYEIKPPHLCCLKLSFIDHETGKNTGGSFSIKYHDMPDVIDFLVLRQTYNIAMQRKWKPQDRFRSMIDDHWWIGTIERQEPFQAEFQDSMYQCFNVHWDNGEVEKLSPWDLEPIDDDRQPGRVGAGLMVEKDELMALLYSPGGSEWPLHGRDEECDRIVHGLAAIMQHSMAESFSTPVDLNLFPDYARIIEYPVDLSTIKARLENRFYRRINALQWDVRKIESNTMEFNTAGSIIVRNAAAVTDTILKFISDTDCCDPMPILAKQMQRMKTYTSSSDSDEVDNASSSQKRKKTRKGGLSKRQRTEQLVTDPDQWKQECRDLVQRVLECEDSKPFRTAVDPQDYPDYYQYVENPMDLCQIREKLDSGQYSSPVEVCRDGRLVFSNSKAYNTNKRSRIYTMTLRLSAMFEDQMKEITSNWKASGRTRRPLKTVSSKSRSTARPSDSIASSSRRDRGPSNVHDGSQSSSSSSSSSGRSGVATRVTRSHGVVEREKDSQDGYSSGPVASRPRPRPRRAAQVIRSTGGKVTRSDGESEEGDDSDEETEIEDANVTMEDDDNDDDFSPSVRRSRRKPPPRSKVESDEDDDDDETEDERPSGKIQPKRGSRISGKTSVSNGYNKPSYRTRATTGTKKTVRYQADESSSLVSKSESTSASSSVANSPNGKNSSNSSSNSSNKDSEEEEEEEEEECLNSSGYVDSKRGAHGSATTKSSSRSIHKQVESVRHSARERRKVQDNIYVYERKPNIRTRNQGRRTVRYREDDSDNERGRNRVVEDEDDGSDSESDTNESRSSPDVTMSSRGRIRKLTPRAKASLLGD